MLSISDLLSLSVLYGVALARNYIRGKLNWKRRRKEWKKWQATLS
jgi:hypothetical protein